MTPLLIGLYSPRPRSGKSTVAAGLRRLLKPARVLSFAGPLRIAAVAILEQMGVQKDAAGFYVYEDKDVPIPGLDGKTTGRDILRLVGETGRSIKPEMWVDGLFARADQLLGRGESVVIDDVRRPNEARAITSRGGYLIRVRRDDAPPAGSDPNEGLLSGLWFTDTIDNSGTFGHLQDEIARVAGWFRSAE